MAVQVKSPAPPFELEGVVGKEFKKVKLSDYKGKWVVLFFYPFVFTFVGPTEILEFSRRESEFAKEGAQVLGVSTDSKFSHLAWVNHELGELKCPLLADFTKQVSKDYGVLLEGLGAALRGTFIIDPDGLVRASIVQDLAVGRSVDEILRLVSALKTGELCPVGWRPGKPFLGK